MKCSCGHVEDNNTTCTSCGPPDVSLEPSPFSTSNNWTTSFLSQHEEAQNFQFDKNIWEEPCSKISAMKPATKKKSKVLSVGILDHKLKVVKRSFHGRDLIRNVPMHHTLGELFSYVSENFFFPPLGVLEPYEYKGKQGVGEPMPLAPETTLRMIKDRQKHRHVQWHRLALHAKADMSATEIVERFHAMMGEAPVDEHNPMDHMTEVAVPRPLTSTALPQMEELMSGSTSGVSTHAVGGTTDVHVPEFDRTQDELATTAPSPSPSTSSANIIDEGSNHSDDIKNVKPIPITMVNTSKLSSQLNEQPVTEGPAVIKTTEQNPGENIAPIGNPYVITPEPQMMAMLPNIGLILTSVGNLAENVAAMREQLNVLLAAQDRPCCVEEKATPCIKHSQSIKRTTTTAQDFKTVQQESESELNMLATESTSEGQEDNLPETLPDKSVPFTEEPPGTVIKEEILPSQTLPSGVSRSRYSNIGRHSPYKNGGLKKKGRK